MQSKTLKYSTAAMIIIAAVFVFNPIGGSSVAWANVVESVNQVSNYVYRMRTIEKADSSHTGFDFVTETETINYTAKDIGIMTESYRGGKLYTQSYSLIQTKEFFGIFPPGKCYDKHQLSQADLQRIQQMTPRHIINRFMSAEHTSLGKGIVKGIEVEGVESTEPGSLISPPIPMKHFRAQLWVDVATELPVWIELEFIPKGASNTTKLVIDQFEWNADFAVDFFKPQIPADYRLNGHPAKPAKVPQSPAPTIAEPYLGRFSNLELPDVNNWVLLGEKRKLLSGSKRLSGHLETWRTQDEFARQWPAYEDVYNQLQQEITGKLVLDTLSTEEIVAAAIALRQRFWDHGGSLSETVYPYAYASRILLEFVHQNHPRNMDIADELGESIMTTETAWQFLEGSDERSVSICYSQTLLSLREAQFEQIQNEIQQGRTPDWKDFVRINDLAILHGWANDYQSALAVNRWLIDHADIGGWSAYLNPLKKMKTQYEKNERFNYNIFVTADSRDAFPEEYRYSRRLPSFQGPVHKKRQVVPLHSKEPNPMWIGD
ncbi:MAG: hypothetical protein ACYSUT_08130 [Planctomycetota bacterium]